MYRFITTRLHHTLTLMLTITLALGLSSCASMGAKTNADLMAKTTGKQFVLSIPKDTLNLDLVSQEKRSDQSILRLVSEADYKLAFQSNGNRLTGPLQVTDPSSKILNSLNKYYQQQYQIKPIAKGTINNIDETFLAKNLNKGDFLLDVRVSELGLARNSSGRFFPTAAFQLTVFDTKKGKYLLQDHCRFSEPNNAQSVRYFSNRDGEELTNFLNRYASHCLNYFANGKPLPTNATPATTTKTSQPKPAPVKTAATSSNTLFRLNLGADVVYYPSYAGEARSFVGSQLGFTLGKPMSPTLNWIMQGQAKIIARDGLPSFGEGSIYATSLGFGTQYMPDANPEQGYLFLLNGQIGQYRQNSVVLSTNAVGLSAGAFRTLFGNVQGIAQYTYWLHLGPTTEANKGGHGLGVGLGYQF